MKKSELVKAIVAKCERIHPNLYHSVAKKDVETFINDVNWDGLSEIEFDCNMLKLFSMFKDAHTSYMNNIPFEGMGINMWYICGKIYLRREGNFLEVKSINGCPAEDVVCMMSGLMNYETESWKNHMLDSKISNGYFYKMLGIAKDRVCVEAKEDGGGLVVVEGEIKSHKAKEKKVSNGQKSSQIPIYNYQIINENVLRLNYRSCQNIEDYPFVQFLEDMKKDLQDKNIEGVVVDLRGNSGGRSSIIVPFVEYVKENNWPCVVLMDNGTFSSGVIAVRDFKVDCGAVLVGEEAGQGTQHYGNCPPFELDGKSISCCTKYFDFSQELGYEGVVKPDIYVRRTLEEFRTGQQTQQVRTAYETINKLIEEKRNEQTKTIE
ncbi:MAG: hypothetical protein J6A28_00225 [Clostridia bacterium]|nr:hypothetical protein [Clostridia bacterium]